MDKCIFSNHNFFDITLEDLFLAIAVRGEARKFTEPADEFSRVGWLASINWVIMVYPKPKQVITLKKRTNAGRDWKWRKLKTLLIISESYNYTGINTLNIRCFIFEQNNPNNCIKNIYSLVLILNGVLKGLNP